LAYLEKRGTRKDRPSVKLDHKYWGSFLVKSKPKPNSYKLELPSSLKVHPVFHTSKLKKHYGELQNIEPPLYIIKGIEKYEVKQILDEREGEFLVRWEGYQKPT
jgi:hypothetical protein